ncbi:MAG: hypothetical protein ACI9O4_002468 [Chitinophagales bacterium]|jgi:hypothetical protein
MRNFIKALLVISLFSLGACKSAKLVTQEEQALLDAQYESNFEDREMLTPSWSLEKGACESPLTELSFKNGFAMLTKEKSEAKRLELAQKIADTNCLTSYQNSRICELFEQENNRVAYAIFAYTKVFDAQNYYWLSDQLSLLSNKKKLEMYIQENTKN